MIDYSKKRIPNHLLGFEVQSLHVIERRSRRKSEYYKLTVKPPVSGHPRDQEKWQLNEVSAYGRLKL